MSNAKSTFQYVLITAGVIAGFGVLTIVVFAIMIQMMMPTPWDDCAFDREVWMAHYKDGKPDNPRGQMLADLEKTVLREGMTKDEVIALLGPPDFDQPSERSVKYRLGSWSGMRIDPDSLEIAFGRDGKVEQVYCVQH